MTLTYEQMKQIVDLSPYPRTELLSEGEKAEVCDGLLKYLLKEQGLIAAFSASYEKKRELVRGYMNRRRPTPVPDDILRMQDALLWTESVERKIVSPEELSFGKYGVGVWQGDIARLALDGIVNAANSSLLGCFLPNHNCIDNVIHSCAGMQLRADCARLVAVQGEEATGRAKITRAYALPSRYVLHTVGPMVGKELTEDDRAALRSSYISCLNLAAEAGLQTLAFCCVSTGVFNFPHEEAAEIATGAVLSWKLRTGSKLKVLFNTFLPLDTEIYQNILKML